MNAVTFSEGLEMFCCSVMESSFCFLNVKFIKVPATSFINDFGPLKSVQAIFAWKIRFDERVFWNMILRLAKE